MKKYYADNKDLIAKQRKERRLAMRDEINAADREKYATDPAYRAMRKNIQKTYDKKIQTALPTDILLQGRHNEKLARRREKHKERLASDPEYRKMVDAYNAKQREKQKAKKELRPK